MAWRGGTVTVRGGSGAIRGRWWNGHAGGGGSGSVPRALEQMRGGARLGEEAEV